MYAYAQQTPEQKAAAQSAYEAHLEAQKQKRTNAFFAFATMVSTGEALKLWTVEKAPSRDDWGNHARATVASEGRSFTLDSTLDHGTVSAHAAPIQDAEGRCIIPRDVLGYHEKAPTVPTAKLERGPAVVAKDLSRRAVNSPEWRRLIDLMQARRSQSLAYRETLQSTAQTMAQALGQTLREPMGSSVTLYPSAQVDKLYKVEVTGDSVRLSLNSLTVAQALQVVGVLRSMQEAEALAP